MLIIPKDIFDAMLAHCREGYPNEVCGILAGSDGEVLKLYRMTNVEPSPVSYLMDAKEQFAVLKDMREKGLTMLAIFHSHPASPAYPSPKDVSLAFYDDCVYLIIGLSGAPAGGEPVVQAYSIKEGRVEEKLLSVR
ncbi:MAG: M67 family metallopeptidase [Alphaproteobacteria bacterium]|uniref:M67 family metallopeptidase n=1 Tax=Candidatus Nitrobium versatile TaxID=2884831 RepID=A0A953J6L9_9BACT|nr:M67 family metallopeptidase [Candidatus Nitrobium versatile]